MIERRATPLPVTIPAGADALLDVFFLVSPPPQRVTVHDRTAQGDQLDTRQTLAALHLAAPPQRTK